ncbi:MAG TPA: DUF998 domain-containing protein [Ignavibacteria bacterium]
MKTKYLLYTGSSIPVVFFVTTFVCGFMLNDYNHFSGMVSELGEIGTKSQFVFSTGLVLCSVLSIFFVIGLYRTCKVAGINVIPVLIILFYSLSIAGAAIFPLPLRLHLIMGMPSILLIFSPLMSLILWNGVRQLSNIKLMSILSFFIMSLGFLAFMPDLLSNYPGLKQRLFHVGWSIWFFYLSFSFIRLLENEKVKNLNL